MSFRIQFDTYVDFSNGKFCLVGSAIVLLKGIARTICKYVNSDNISTYSKYLTEVFFFELHIYYINFIWLWFKLTSHT